MKKYISLLIMLISFDYAFSENLKGFWGVNFGEDKANVIKMMENRGWKEKKSNAEEITFSMQNAKYAGLSAGDITFKFLNNKFSSVMVIIDMNSTDKINDVAEALIDKYELSLVKQSRINTQKIPGEIKMYLSPNGNTFGYTLLTVGTSSIAQFQFLSTEAVLDKIEIEKENKRESMKDDL